MLLTKLWPLFGLPSFFHDVLSLLPGQTWMLACIQLNTVWRQGEVAFSIGGGILSALTLAFTSDWKKKFLEIIQTQRMWREVSRFCGTKIRGLCRRQEAVAQQKGVAGEEAQVAERIPTAQLGAFQALPPGMPVALLPMPAHTGLQGL